jgi:23S rRNA (guanosine2251-2'-O)-methyltransferase
MTKPNFVYGLHAIAALLEKNPQRVRQVFIQKGREDTRIAALRTLAQEFNISVQSVSRSHLDEWTENAVHQGIVAQVIAQTSLTETDLFSLLDQLQTAAFLLILDGVQDPHNLGACMRTANAAGVHAVIIPKDKSVALTPTVLKVASGAAEITPVVAVTNLARVLRELKKRGIWIYGACDSAEKSIYQENLQGDIAIVLGAEGTGLRRLTEEHCDQLLHIPMQGTVSSLNVSVATGICLFEAVRQRT